MDATVAPEDRFVLKNLAGASAGWLLRSILGRPSHLAQIIDSKATAVVAAKRGLRDHSVLLPKKWATGQLGPEAAKVFSVRVGNGRFRFTASVPKIIGPIFRKTVGTSQGAEVGHYTVMPEKLVDIIIAGQQRIALDLASVADASGSRERPAQRAEVVDDVSNFMRFLRMRPRGQRN